MTPARERTLIARYRRVNAYGDALQAALPNAREVGLSAYVPIQREYDRQINRCAKMLRKLAATLNEAD